MLDNVTYHIRVLVECHTLVWDLLKHIQTVVEGNEINRFLNTEVELINFSLVLILDVISIHPSCSQGSSDHLWVFQRTFFE